MDKWEPRASKRALLRVPAAIRHLRADLSGDVLCYLEKRVINEGSAGSGYSQGGRRMINLNELSC